jgi:hypothetical protein
MEQINQQLADLEARLNDFDANIRAEALAQLNAMAQQGAVQLAAEADVANMHCHTFFSFNAYGYSPTALAWLAKRRGFKLMGIVDFDVLDGVDEFLDACEAVGVRGTAGIETRVFIPEFATREINSPGEPGICYHMGIGFTSSQVPGSVAGILADMRRQVAQRNQGLIARVNAHLKPVAIDYQRDVLPLTPGGNPTERHIVVAYLEAAERVTPDPIKFWADKLDAGYDEVAALTSDLPKLQNLIRSRLMKRGGVGYVEPSHDMSQGAVALNIIPDRNWNIADPELRQIKVRHLMDIVQLAQELALPLNVGTEMNSFGQKLIDDFDAPELIPVRQAFLDGAYFIYGHTALQRALGLGYLSEWAQTHLPTRRQRNEFYTRVGYRVPPGRASMARLRQTTVTRPGDILDQIG